MPKRVLLDENLPQRLRLFLAGYEAVTVAYQGWAGISNGALVAAAEQAGFDVMITADQGLNYQQNLKGRALAVVVLSTNRNSLVIENAMRVLSAIDAAQPGGFIIGGYRVMKGGLSDT
jgi:predicted nuclease of predicted toxin-antitoxin system